MQYQIIFSKKMTEITDYLIDKLAEIFNLFFQLTGDYGISLFLLQFLFLKKNLDLLRPRSC